MNRGMHLVILLAVALALGVLLPVLREPVGNTGTTMEMDSPRQAEWWFTYERDLKDFRSATVTLPSGYYVLESDLVFDENGAMIGVYNRLGQPVLVRDQESFRAPRGLLSDRDGAGVPFDDDR